MPEQIVSSVFKWLSGVVAILIGIIWRKNESRFKSIEAAVDLRAKKHWVDEIDADLEVHKKEHTALLLASQKEYDRFVTHDYLEKEIKPWIEGAEHRINLSLDKLDLRIEKLTDNSTDLIKRHEYKTEIGVLYQRLEGKQDKPR